MNARKIFSIMLMAATASAFVACSNDNEPIVSTTTNEATVTFSASLPGTINSRATSSTYADGTKATTLYYAVYSTDNKLVITNYGKSGDANYVADEVSFVNLNATVNITLPIGQTYKFAFWAQSPEVSCYTFNPATANMTVDYSSMICSNDNLDAFYAHETLTFGSSTEQKSIQLTRPFAQLNIGVCDYALAKECGMELAESQLTVVGICNTLNLLTDQVSGFATSIFDYNVIPANQVGAGVFPAKIDGEYVDAQYAAMAYVLIADGKQTFDVQFNYKDNSGTVLNSSDIIYIHNVPMERNHRTNVFGDLLTVKQEWTISIDNSFIEPDYNDVFSNL